MVYLVNFNNHRYNYGWSIYYKVPKEREGKLNRYQFHRSN